MLNIRVFFLFFGY